MDSADFAVADVSGGKYKFKNKMRMGRLYRYARECQRAGFRMVMNRQTNREIGGTRSYQGMTRALRLLAGDQEVPQNQCVHLGTQKTVYGFFRAADDWLVIVEGGV